jgi:hypothetical protein
VGAVAGNPHRDRVVKARVVARMKRRKKAQGRDQGGLQLVGRRMITKAASRDRGRMSNQAAERSELANMKKMAPGRAPEGLQAMARTKNEKTTSRELVKVKGKMVCLASKPGNRARGQEGTVENLLTQAS